MSELFETESRTVPISKEMVRKAYKKVKANQGRAGIDNESLTKFQADISKNLYRIWNRLSSGSYFPPSVKAVEIPKAQGGIRTLGIPTVSDRIAQEVIKSYLEPRLEAQFHDNSYGYRPLKSAHQAIQQVQENVRNYAWVVDMDIKSFFDEIDHELLEKALEKHVEEAWVKMYIRRWLQAEMEGKKGEIEKPQGVGTPQGGVISPLLANLYLHYALDKWLEINYPSIRFVRYADDVVLHCNSEEEANNLLNAIRNRLEKCKLRLSETKTQIVYCKDYRRQKKTSYKNKFGFLGFDFKPKMLKSKQGPNVAYLGYVCEMSQKAIKRINDEWKAENWQRNSTLTMSCLSQKLNPQMRGIIQYYGKINHTGVHKLIRRLHFRLAKWAMNKYKSLRGSYRKVFDWLLKQKSSYPNLFYHWTIYNWI